MNKAIIAVILLLATTASAAPVQCTVKHIAHERTGSYIRFSGVVDAPDGANMIEMQIYEGEKFLGISNGFVSHGGGFTSLLKTGAVGKSIRYVATCTKR